MQLVSIFTFTISTNKIKINNSTCKSFNFLCFCHIDCCEKGIYGGTVFNFINGEYQPIDGTNARIKFR